MQLLVSARGKNCSGFRVTRCHPSLWFFISYLSERVAIFIALATIAEKYWNVRVLWHFAKCVLGHRVKIDFLQWNFTTFLLRSNINIFGGNNVSLIRWYLITKFIEAIKVQFEMEKYRIIKNFLKNIYLSIKNSFAPFNYIQIFFYYIYPLSSLNIIIVFLTMIIVNNLIDLLIL